MAYIRDDVEAEVGEVEQRLLVGRLELRVRHELVQVVLRDAVLRHYVQSNDTHLVEVHHRLRYNRRLILVSLMQAFKQHKVHFLIFEATLTWSRRTGTMLRMWSLIFSPSASVPMAKS